MVDGLRDACERIGRTVNPAPSFKRWAEETGFTRVEEKRFKLPVGDWPKDPRLKEIGAFLSVNISEGVEGFTAVLFRDVLGWSQEEVEVLNARVRAVVKRMALQIRQEHGFIKQAPKDVRKTYQQLRRDLRNAEKAFRDDMTKVYQEAYRRRMHNEALERQLSGRAIKEQAEASSAN
ncbi:hypothetical protein HIM_08347 [Hirsutella minnesotensis 3608]|uniref:Uncharacterized protein n=1 Tax=Hirsutella minnesotensis 3608 TaxID=1043627 RepID=A0A0F7ZHA6_9HYPO|nr:hypothetical protein HIM_08347 [Hirsutella minnesotensis 3608]